MWTRKDYEDAAQKIGNDFVAGGGAESINDLSLKVAQAATLNPDGIRTMVRLANVSAFEKYFEKGAQAQAPDRMIEFAVGDPEIVISQLYNNAKVAHEQVKVAGEYNRSLDYYGDLKYEKPPMEKTASAVPGYQVTTPEEKLPSKMEIRLLFKRAEDQMRAEQDQAQVRWFTNLEKVAKLLISKDSRVESRTVFEKNAASLLGEDVVPELHMVNSLTSHKQEKTPLFGGEKVATVLDTHISSFSKDQQPIIDLLKEACAARKVSNVKKTGLDWLANNLQRIS
jgi:hypothetical protein